MGRHAHLGDSELVPRLVGWLLRRTLPAAQVDAVTGDLNEAAQRRRPFGRSLRTLLHALAIAVEFRLRGSELRRSAAARSTPARRELRGERPSPLMGPVDGVRQALRTVRRAPALTTTVALTLGLGIGANATMFRVVDRLLLSAPDHIREPERVRRVLFERASLRTGERFTSSITTHPDFVDLSGASSFEVAGYASIHLVMGRGPEARRVAAVRVSGNFFELLGAEAARGRFFTPDEDRVQGDAVAVISHGLWQSAFGADPEIVGRIVDVAGDDFTVIGVAPRGFTGVDLQAVDVWLPLHVSGWLSYGDEWIGHRGFYWFSAIARLSGDAPLATAEAEASNLHRVGRAESIDAERWDPAARVVLADLIAARGPQPSAESRVATWLSGVSALVLLIACANVANLLLANGIVRRRELAIRGAIGVSRSRLAWQLFAEASIMAALGGGAAAAMAHFGANLLRAMLLPDIDFTHGVLSTRVLVFTAIATLTTCVVAGLIPALRAGGRDPGTELRSAGQTTTGGRSLLRGGLLVTQGTLTVVLLTGAGLFIRSLDEVGRLDLGFEPHRVGMFDLTLAPGERSHAEHIQVAERALAEVQRSPTVEAAAIMTPIPFSGSWTVPFSVPGREFDKPESGGPFVYTGSPDSIRTLGMRIVRGRDLRASDRIDSRPVALVTESMARGIWGSADAIGECMELGWQEPKRCFEVVGVVADVRQRRLVGPEIWSYYIPLAQAQLADNDMRPGSVLVRTANVSATLADGRGRLLQLEDVDFVRPRRYRDLIDPQTRSWRLGATMFSVFSGLAVVMAGIGLYSVLAFAVASRSRELGIRSALGAAPWQIRRIVLRQGLGVAVVSGFLGLLVSLAATPVLEPLLFRVSARDPGVLATVLATLLIGTLGAALGPAVRASRVDPETALREA